MTEQWFTVGDDFEAAARQAVAEEDGERARLKAARVPAQNDLGGDSLIQQQAEAIEGLHRELAARLALIERQAAALGDARAVFVLLVLSRPYQLMRLLGRWGWLEQRILRALR